MEEKKWRRKREGKAGKRGNGKVGGGEEKKGGEFRKREIEGRKGESEGGKIESVKGVGRRGNAGG